MCACVELRCYTNNIIITICSDLFIHLFFFTKLRYVNVNVKSIVL